MDKKKIGWIGLGKMGIPMSANLIRAGYELTVYNRNIEKTEILKAIGATVALTPQILFEKADIVIVMVTDDDAVNDIFKGAHGLLASKAKGRTIINMSTVSPAVNSEMAFLCEAQGSFFLDAPVSGSLKQAEEATLVIMAGGNEEVFNRVKPVLEHIGRLAVLVGGIGFGNKAKLVINTMLAVYSQGLAEAVIFAEDLGIHKEDLIMLFNNSALGSPLLKVKGEMLVDEIYSASFTLKNLAKDLRLANEIGLSSPLASVAYKSFQDAALQYPEEDIISIIKFLDK